MQTNKSKIHYYSSQLEIDPFQEQLLCERSQTYQIQGLYDQAISDCSKLIMIAPSPLNYIRRSQLLKHQRQFLAAIKDIEQAKSYKQNKQQETPGDIFLQRSLCTQHLNQVQQMAKLIQTCQKDKQQKLSAILSQILSIKDHASNSIIHSQESSIVQPATKTKLKNKKQIEELKMYYDNQVQQLKAQFMAQLAQLKEGIKYTFKNYGQRLKQQLQVRQDLNQEDVTKLIFYHKYVVSEMEKYYVAAKNLKKIQDKTIKFEDFQQMIVNKNKNDYLLKIYKFFDKYSKEMGHIIQFIHDIPYVGTVFNVVKCSMKAKGWVQEINIENQCHNIQRISSNITSFNQFSINLAFYMAKFYEKSILGPHEHYKTKWEQLVLKIKQIKRQNVGVSFYKHHIDPQLQKVKDFALIHASIIMVAYACNKLQFSTDRLKAANKFYETKQMWKVDNCLQEIYNLIDNVTKILKDRQSMKQGSKLQNPTLANVQHAQVRSFCNIY